MRFPVLVVVGFGFLVVSQAVGASHRQECAQSHDYFVADDAFVNLDPENRDLGIIDYIDLYCAAGWNHWPQLEFETVGADPCWWLTFESPQMVNLTIGTACLTPPHVAVSTAGVVHVT